MSQTKCISVLPSSAVYHRGSGLELSREAGSEFSAEIEKTALQVKGSRTVGTWLDVWSFGFCEVILNLVIFRW